MTSKSNATTKRKADACDSVVVGGGGKKPRAEDEPPPPLHLPPPVWGRVLDYIPYQEVRSALLICKAIANEAVKYVHTLNIMGDCELDIPAARRFPNVEHVNVLCLVKENEDRRLICSPLATKATVPFLQLFPRLSSVFVGGIDIDGDKTLYSRFKCRGDRHMLLFRSLVSSFVGAFKTRALSQAISVLGVIHRAHLYPIIGDCKLEREEEASRNECHFCRDACKYLPLKDCQLFESGHWRCLDNETKEGILRGRKGGMGVIIWTKCAEVVDVIKEKRTWHVLDHDIKADRDLHGKLVEMGLEDDRDGDPQYFSSEGLKEIDRLVESLGITPRDIPKELCYERMGFGMDGRDWDVWCKSAIDSLIARGYPIDPNDLIIVDEEQEPALQRIIQEEKGP